MSLMSMIAAEQQIPTDWDGSMAERVVYI